MTKAQNIIALHEGGYTKQAIASTKSESTWAGCGDDGFVVYGFPDGSGIVTENGTPLREMTHAELHDWSEV